MADTVPTVTAVTDDALGADDMCALLDRLAAGEVSPDEVRAAARARVQAVQPDLNAIVDWVDAGLASTDGPLAGIPTAVKNNEDIAGYRTGHGSRAAPGRPAAATSPWVQQALGLGLAPVATTTLPEFGLTASTESTATGATRNPWNPAHSVGGSSGGSAALVAAGALPIAHANDGGGSIRIPAACCGLVGLSPTRGRLIDRPELARMPVPIVRQGVLTRSVRDTAAYFAAAEHAWRAPDLPPIGHTTVPGRLRLRVGVVRQAPHDITVSADTVAAVDAAAAALEHVGHHVEAIDPPVGEQFARDFLLYWQLLAWALRRGAGLAFGQPFDRTRLEPFTDYLAQRLRLDAPHVPGALTRLRRMARQPEPVFARFDVVLSPVLAHPPPPIGALGPGADPEQHLVRLLRWTAFTPLANVTGSPALAMPWGRSAQGLPIGVQVSAARGHERRLLEIGYEMESARP